MPSMTNKLTHAPFTPGGSLQHYTACRQAHGVLVDPVDATCCHSTVWLPNDPFNATLQISHMNKRGYSARYVNWVSPHAHDDRVFPMFIADLLDLMQNIDHIDRGIVTERWMVRKRGQNYGLCLA